MDKLEPLRNYCDMPNDRHISVPIPSQFDGHKMAVFAENFARQCPDNVIPGRVVIDFAGLRFIRASGVVFLNNFVKWLHSKGCSVGFSGLNASSRPIAYLDDSLFFKIHLGDTLREDAALRSTTPHPLMEIQNSAVHFWLENKLIPWIASRIGVTVASLHRYKVIISEIFNNIQDHTRFDIGSIFVQHYPNENSIMICVADWGVGIPETVRRQMPNISDNEAIQLAVEEGFTSRSQPGNRGVGLHLLIEAVVRQNRGKVTIFSRNGTVVFSESRGSVQQTPIVARGFCPGTAIEIVLKTDTIEHIPDEMEDLEW